MGTLNFMIMQQIHPSARLKILRQTLNMSQRDLAREFNVSSAAIALWELGSNPVPGPLIKLMDIYEGVRPELCEDHKRFDKTFSEAIKSFENHSEEIAIIKSGLAAHFLELSSFNCFKVKFKYALAKKIMSYLNNQKGLTIKAVQLASYLEAGLPVEVRLALGNLQSSMKPMPKKLLVEIIESTYGCSLEEVFPLFEMTPVAVTSLGQVHYAKRKNGEEVAVKIQSKEIEKTLQSQMKKIAFMEKLGSFINKDIAIIGQEIKRALLQECDYLEEARNQNKIREITLNYPRTIVPKVHMDLTRKNILVSEFIHAQNFNTFARVASQASKNVVAEAFIRTLSNLAFSHGMVMGDIHPENFLVKNDKVVFLDFGRIFNPPAERMLPETMFYRCLLLNEKEKAKKLATVIGFAKDETQFNFDEFWYFLKTSQTHLMKDEKFKFSRDYLALITRESRRYANQGTLQLSKETFWGFTFSAGTWGIYAELEAECNWRKIALETFDEALKKSGTY